MIFCIILLCSPSSRWWQGGQMQYAPTLGGLLRLRILLEKAGFPLPVFETMIYRNSKFHIGGPSLIFCRYLSGEGLKTSLEEEIFRYGESCPMWDCRLSSEDGLSTLEFAHPDRVPWVYDGLGFLTKENWVHMEGGFPQEAREKISKLFTTIYLFNVARWGKSDPTRWDRFLLKWLPSLYRFPKL